MARPLPGNAPLEPLHPDDPRELGSYRLLRRVGEGGMGVVFLAVAADGQGDDLAAVKAIRPEYAGDREFRARFASEVDLARRVRGPYTARVLAADTEGRQPWLATEFVPGPELDDAVRDSGVFPEDSLRALAAGLAEALSAIHGVGLIHRDLKPSNVLLSPRGPQVIDFGIARAADATALTRTGQTLGTPGYMSPEQATGAYVGPRSDLFAFGGVLLFAATGRQPFGTGSASALLYRVVNESPDLRGVPDGLLPLVTACLAKDPDERPDLAAVSAELTGTALPVDGEGTTEWLPQAVATKLLRTMAATRITPTGALNQEPVPEEELEREEAVSPDDASAPTEEPEAAAEAPGPAPEPPEAKDTGPQHAAGSEALQPKRPPVPALDWSTPDRYSQPSESHRKWPWAAAAVALFLVSALALAYVDDGASSAGPEPDSLVDTESTPSPVSSPSPTTSPTPGPSPDDAEPEITDTVFLGDGDRFAVLFESGPGIFEADSPEALEQLTPEDDGALFEDSRLVTNPDGSVLAAISVSEAHGGKAEVYLWDLDSSEQYSFELPEETNTSGEVALSPDGQTLYFASHSTEDAVIAYSRNGEELYRASLPENERGEVGRVNGLVTSPDGALLFATMRTGLAVWDAATGEAHPSYPELREADHGLATPVAVADDVLVTGTYQSALLWDMYSADGPEEFFVREGSIASGARLHQVAVGDGGDRIYASGADSDRSLSFLTVWDREGERLEEAGTGTEYLSLSASPHDDRLLAATLPLGRQAPGELVFLDGDLATDEEFTVPDL